MTDSWIWPRLVAWWPLLKIDGSAAVVCDDQAGDDAW